MIGGSYNVDMALRLIVAAHAEVCNRGFEGVRRLKDRLESTWLWAHVTSGAPPGIRARQSSGGRS